MTAERCSVLKGACLQHSVSAVLDTSRRKRRREGRNKAASGERGEQGISQALLIVWRSQEARRSQTKHEEAVMPTCTKGNNPERTPQGCLPKRGTCSHADQSWNQPLPLPSQNSWCTDLTHSNVPEGCFGQALMAGSACGWTLWQDCSWFCALRTAPGPMQGTQAWYRKIHSKGSAHRTLSEISFSLFQWIQELV